MSADGHPLYALYRALYDLGDPDRTRWVLHLCAHYRRGTMPWPTLILDLARLPEERFVEAERAYLADPTRVQRLPRWLATQLGAQGMLTDPQAALTGFGRWRDAFEWSLDGVRRMRERGYAGALQAAHAALVALQRMVRDDRVAAHDAAWSALEAGAADGDWETPLLRVLSRYVHDDGVDCRRARRDLAAERFNLTRRNEELEGSLQSCVRMYQDATAEAQRLRARLPPHVDDDGGVERRRLARSGLRR
jgi:hypothetical protein